MITHIDTMYVVRKIVAIAFNYFSFSTKNSRFENFVKNNWSTEQLNGRMIVLQLQLDAKFVLHKDNTKK